MAEAEPRGVIGLLLSAGSGARLGSTPKAFLEVGGEPLLMHALRSMAVSSLFDRILLVVPAGCERTAADLARSVPSGRTLTAVCPGGPTRQESVRRGLDEISIGSTAPTLVVCHDAARPFATPELFRRVVRSFPGPDGVVPVVSSSDTVKRLLGSRVAETIPRDEVGLAQTPQAFTAGALAEAHRLAAERGLEATDDASLLEAAGFAVETIKGEPGNFKITTPDDLLRAEEVLRERRRELDGGR